METRKLNIQTIITVVTFVGSLFGVWRAVEMKAFALEQEQKEIRSKMAEYVEVQKKMIDQLTQNTLSIEKTATILDQHIKYQHVQRDSADVKTVTPNLIK